MTNNLGRHAILVIPRDGVVLELNMCFFTGQNTLALVGMIGVRATLSSNDAPSSSPGHPHQVDLQSIAFVWQLPYVTMIPTANPLSKKRGYP